MRTIVKFGIQLLLPDGWVDSSDNAGNSDRLLTLSKPDGVGAFQMSFAQYVSGKLPNIKLDDLRDLLSKFAAIRRLGPELESAAGGQDGATWCRAEYHWKEDFVRVWYISDSKSVILATYVCNWQRQGIEIRDCDRIVESVKFVGPEEGPS